MSLPFHSTDLTRNFVRNGEPREPPFWEAFLEVVHSRTVRTVRTLEAADDYAWRWLFPFDHSRGRPLRFRIAA